MSLVLYKKKGRIAYITLNRPEHGNAMSHELLDELIAAWLRFRDDDESWVAILSSNGKAFCIGADLKKTKDREQPVGGPTTWLSEAFVFRAVPEAYDVWKPVIAAVHGYVLGIGLWLSLSCDFRIAAEDAEFGFPEVRWAVPVPVTAHLLNYMCPTLVHELLLVGDRISAQRAYESLLVNRVVPREELMQTATALAERICENSPLMVRAMKKVLVKGRYLDLAGKTALAQEIIYPVLKSSDRIEAIDAFAAKRTPVYKGV